MIRHLIQIVGLGGLVASSIWLWLEPGPEPFVTLVASLGTFLGSLAGDRSLEAIPRFGYIIVQLAIARERLLRFILAYRYRRWSPEARLKFYWPNSGDVRLHEIVANRLWDSEGPSEIITLTHFSPSIDPYDFFQFRGHSVNLFAEDFDGDKAPEVAVTYHCGAHSMGLRLFHFDEYGVLVPIKGSEIGSDCPEITWEDKDGDGRYEIYAKNRNWAGNSPIAFIEERYIWDGETYSVDPRI